MLRRVSSDLEDFKQTHKSHKKQSIFQYYFVPVCSLNDWWAQIYERPDKPTKTQTGLAGYGTSFFK